MVVCLNDLALGEMLYKVSVVGWLVGWMGCYEIFTCNRSCFQALLSQEYFELGIRERSERQSLLQTTVSSTHYQPTLIT